MRSSTRKKLLPLVFALVVTVVGAALAVPLITVNVQQLGAGSSVITSDVKAANVTWILSSTNPDYIAGVSFTLDTNVTGTIYIKLYDSTGALVAYNTTTLTNSTSGTVTFDPNIPLSEVAEVYVIYQGP